MVLGFEILKVSFRINNLKLLNISWNNIIQV
jgi:hypothetical protein